MRFFSKIFIFSFKVFLLCVNMAYVKSIQDNRVLRDNLLNKMYYTPFNSAHSYDEPIDIGLDRVKDALEYGMTEANCDLHRTRITLKSTYD